MRGQQFTAGVSVAIGRVKLRNRGVQIVDVAECRFQFGCGDTQIEPCAIRWRRICRRHCFQTVLSASPGGPSSAISCCSNCCSGPGDLSAENQPSAGSNQL